MKNSKALFRDFVDQITLHESKEEINAIAYLVFENVFGLGRAELMGDKPVIISEEKSALLRQIAGRINRHEPIQYILGETEFFGRKIKVDSSVLIPRPETEELVKAVLSSTMTPGQIKILDIGTGSGCIAITLAIEIKGSEVLATDVSTGALAIARQNAKDLQAPVTFIVHNILTEEIPVHEFAVIVSNPPYITEAESNTMKSNVLDFEPHAALFVQGNDALLFYRAITGKGFNALRNGGYLAVEINERFGQQVADLFASNGFVDVKIIRDLSGKDRIVCGKKSLKAI